MSFPVDFPGLKKLYLPQALPEASYPHLSGRKVKTAQERVNWSTLSLWCVTIVPNARTA